jgi:hypothetical protein
MKQEEGRTSLGEEGAKALIRIRGLALFGQVAIGLVRVNLRLKSIPMVRCSLECRARGSRAEKILVRTIVTAAMLTPYLPARVCDLATSLANCDIVSGRSWDFDRG